jgi:hypothetical protein
MKWAVGCHNAEDGWWNMSIGYSNKDILKAIDHEENVVINIIINSI